MSSLEKHSFDHKLKKKYTLSNFSQKQTNFDEIDDISFQIRGEAANLKFYSISSFHTFAIFDILFF